MIEPKKFLCNERGFMLLNVVFLTLITSFAAMILLNAAPRIKNPQATLRLTAFHLANEQFAYLESKAAAGTEIIGGHSFLGVKGDLKSENLNEKNQIEFEVKTSVVSEDSNLRRATVKVSWQVGEKIFEVTAERTIFLVKNS